jgi:hypothetical protein
MMESVIPEIYAGVKCWLIFFRNILDETLDLFPEINYYICKARADPDINPDLGAFSATEWI